MDLCPNQEFNTIFIQKYEAGTSVKKHRDPRNNIGYIIIAVFGDYDGAVSRIYHEETSGSTSFHLKPGDVLVLPCTIDGKQGPAHEVSEIEDGTRYAIILNTIIKDN